ncbi:MAG TPA: hypothetical protein VFK79_05610 [Xanthobacteraceae bacterium]|nr:hypothetical protein [Xanthobacteraceae bacterium]
MRNSLRRLITLTIATVVAGLFGTAAGFAAVIAAAGGPLLRIDTRSSTDVASTSSTSFVNLPNAHVRIVIPATGGSRLVVARFSAESTCGGTSLPSFCQVRIIAFNTGTSVTTEMHPQAGVNFAFDSVSVPAGASDAAEGHSVERSLRLDPGTYLIRVQWAVTAADTNFNLDDWHLTVSQYD